jgi:threonine synthase
MGLLSPGMALSSCPSCGSSFLQPLRCEPQGDQDVLVDLRCPECMITLQAPYSRADMAELDRHQSEWREEIVAAYERSVTESMEALVACLVPALDRDLIGADDFALPLPRRAA